MGENNVKVVKLVSGEEVVCKLGQSQVRMQYELESPMSLRMVPRGDTVGIVMIPFSVTGKVDKVEIDATHVLCVMEPTEDLQTQYLSSLAGIIPAKSKIVL